MLLPSELIISEKNINKEIEQRIISYNKNKLKKEILVFQNERRIELNNEAYKLTPEEKKQTLEKRINSNDVIQLKEKLYKQITKEKEDFIDLRSDLYGLNKVNLTNLQEYIHIEKSNLYSFDKLPKFNDLLLSSLKFKNIFYIILKEKREMIENLFKPNKDFDKNKVEDLKYNSLQTILKIRDMYEVSDDTEDYELFDKYDFKTNIDFCEDLSQLLIETVKYGDNYSNFLNEFTYKNTLIKFQNINEIIKTKAISNKFLAILFSNKYISNNEITCFENMFDTTRTNRDVYMTRTLGELLIEITNHENINVSKEKRQQIYMTYDGTRPESDEYHKWNGLQIFDLDLKDWINLGGNIDELKSLLHNMLQNFSWYLWICKSASGNGLHIYSKVSPPLHLFTEIKLNEYIGKYIHRINFLTKRQVVYDLLYRLHINKSNDINFSEIKDYGYYKEANGELTGKSFENKYLDNVTGRITAGIRLAFDTAPLINPNFIDLPVGFALTKNIEGIEESNIQDIFVIKTKDNLYNNFIREIDEELAIENEEQYNEFISGQRSNMRETVDLSKYEGMVNLSSDLDEIKAIPKSQVNYFTRYNICNTLAALFSKDALPLAHILLDSQGNNNVGEINSFYSCAISNRKEPSKVGLELLKKFGVIKSIQPELQQEVAKTFKDELKDKINQVLDNDLINVDYHLGEDEYLSTRQDDLEKQISGEYVNIILSPPGSGKTQFIINLALQGKRILLALPYVSVIKNKIENDAKIRKHFDIFYGSADFRQIENNRNIVTTFDKLSRANYEKIARMFDYIFIDESHLLFTSQYRIETTSNVIKKIKDLYYISNNDPFAAKMVLLTGTEVGEANYFSKVAQTIRLSKKSHTKTMEFLVCDDTLDAITRMSVKIAELLKDDYKIMIPTNKGELYTEKLVGMIEHLLNRPIKYGYYKRSNIEQEICKLINEENTVGEFEVIFCSNYLSVGVDINDDNIKFASIYLGNFSAYEIEQFNARIRRESIKSMYCIVTQKADHTINNDLLFEPDLILRITDDEAMNFIDDKSIASAKNEFLATYDPILKKITTPGFSVVNGRIDFVVEEYELISFETKYSLCMEHPIKVARELAKYGYSVSVSDEFIGLNKAEQEKLKKLGIESMHNEKKRKHNLLVGTFIDLINNNNYTNEHNLEFHNLMDWIQKNMEKVIEDRELVNEDDPEQELFVKPIYDLFATPVEVIVKNREALEKMLKSARFLIKRYSETKAINIIMQYVDSEGILKQKYFQRSINLLKLIDSSEANELAEPIAKSLDKMYNFVDQFETNKTYRIGYETWNSQLDTWVNEYVDDLGIKLSTKYAYDKIRDGLTEMMSDLSTRQTSKNGIRFSYNKLPEQDSSLILNRRSIDSLVTNMFNITEHVIQNKKKLKDKHIVLETQEF